MIQRRIPVNISPTPREIEQEIWQMDSVEQTDLLLAMSQRFSNECASVQSQIYAVSIDVKKELNADERRNVIHLLECILEYVKEDNNE